MTKPYLTRPTGSIDHRAIGEIRTGVKHTGVKAATRMSWRAFLRPGLRRTQKPDYPCAAMSC
jgi:hypothetical protein